MRDRVISVIQGFKQAKKDSHANTLPIYAEKDCVGVIRFINGVSLKDLTADAKLLTDWRNNQSTAFFTWFHATDKSTLAWLQKIYLTQDDDLMCMLENKNGEPFGHLAIYNLSEDGKTCEFGRVLRGTDGGIRSGMYWGALALLRWAAEKLEIETFFLEVFADNHKAIALYEKLGFIEENRFPLTALRKSNEVHWKKLDASADSPGEAEKYAIRMSLNSASLI